VVFISHSSAEKPSVEALARELAGNGVEPWYAGWEMGPETQYVLSENGNESFCRYAAPSVGRYELHERRWRLIRDLFPPPKAAGRRRRDPRQMLDAILWILSGGAPWRDLPERYGPWQSAYHRYRIWTNDGTFGRILERLQVRDAFRRGPIASWQQCGSSRDDKRRYLAAHVFILASRKPHKRAVLRHLTATDGKRLPGLEVRCSVP